MENVIIQNELNKLNDTQDILESLANSCDYKTDSKYAKALNRLELFRGELLDISQNKVTITKDNIHLYYEFMNDEDKIKNSFILCDIFDRRQDKIAFILNQDRGVYEVATFEKPNGDAMKIFYYLKKHWRGISLISFGVEDTLKPINEYITEIKESKAYKEYKASLA